MQIHCSICTDSILESDDAWVVQCGHVFHHDCLFKWLDTSSTCPQCRASTTKRKVFKLYFVQHDLNRSQLFSPQKESSKNTKQIENALEEALQSLKQVKKENALMTEEKKRAEERLKNMEKELSNTKMTLKEEEVKSKLLKYELKGYQALQKDLEMSRHENEMLKKKIETLSNIQLVVDGCETDINKMVKDCTDIEQLATWCIVYKRELDRKKIDLRLVSDTQRRLKRESETHRLELVKTQELLKQLEEKNFSKSEEIKSLKKKIDALQAAIASPRNTAASLVHRLMHESPAPLNLTLPSPAPTMRIKMNKNEPPPILNLSSSETLPELKRPQISNGKDMNVILEDLDNMPSLAFNRKRKAANSDNTDNNIATFAAKRVATSSNNPDLDENNKSVCVKKLIKSKNNSSKCLARTSSSSDFLDDAKSALNTMQMFRRKLTDVTSKSSFMTAAVSRASSSQPQNSSSSFAMICRKGYDGLGGHQKFVAPVTSKNALSKPGLTRKNIGPSTSTGLKSNPTLPSLWGEGKEDPFDDLLTL